MESYAAMMKKALAEKPETVNSVLPRNDMPSPPYTPGNTYLHLAVNGLWDQEKFDVIKTLLEHGANPNVQNDYGWTPLHFASAVETRNKEIVCLLLEHGADPNVLTNRKETPLSMLVGGGDEEKEIASMLLEHGASLDQNAERWLGPPRNKEAR